MAQNSVLEEKYPAKSHCRKVAQYLKPSLSQKDAPITIYLQGQKTRLIEDNDEPQPFRQRRNFFYLSGCAVPDCHLAYHVSTDRLTLFIPPLDPDSVIWSGLPLSPAAALKKYDVDEVLASTELKSQLASTDPNSTLVMREAHLDSLPNVHKSFSTVDYGHLQDAIDECRVTKDSYEIALLRKANEVSAAAHIAVLKKLKHAKNEQELEAAFVGESIAQGCKEQAYHGIFGSGHNAATLHYQANDQPLSGRWNLLVDAAAEYECYCADVTRTMPLAGTFNKESEGIYKIVQQMQDECLGLLKADVQWENVHVKAHEVAIEGLIRLGILKGDRKVIFDTRTSVAFFPHGLGHYLGMDTHDTGGRPDYNDMDKMFQYLRVRGKLLEGSVITVEPGVYFCRFIIEPYLKDEKHAKFIDEKVLEQYWDVGGVRIEDDILITKDGYENLTTAPKGIDNMMKIIDG
ncbi:hypothetical protein MMC28_001503 [Mycoblastus sanguinarius]|nr:hypothetical protein [Mycoblastus sanguinarius]